MTVSVEYAKEHLDDILSAADSGKSVEIIRPDKPVILLQPRELPTEESKRGERVLGAGIGLLRVPSDEEWDEMDREWRASYMHKFDGIEAG